MDHRLAEALANTAVLAASAVGLWWYWRREARRHPEAFAPVVPPPDLALVAAELVAERRRALDLAEAARVRLEAVERAFAGGIRDGRRRR